jgi:integrase
LASAGHLNERTITALRPKAGQQYVVWDHATPGFGVRVSPSGTKAFILKYRLHSGRVRWKTLGRVGAMPLDGARRQAKKDIGLVADGRDPMRLKDAARDALTLGAVADRFLEDHVAARRKPATLRLYTLAIDGHLRPRLGTVPIADVAADDILKLHHRLRGTPYMANRVLAVASKLMNWAAQAGYRGAGPHVNPCDGIEKYRERPRKRYLTAPELARVGSALRVAERRQAMSPGALAAIRLLMLTGARVSEVLSLQWAHVDLQAGALRLPDSKTGAKVILLSGAAVAILKGLPRWANNAHVFPGEGRGDRKGEHRVSLTDAWAWVRQRAKVPDVRLHDLRHSYASIAVSSGLSLPTIGALLGHSQTQTTARYAHLLDDPLRAASDATGATIAAALVRRPKR